MPGRVAVDYIQEEKPKSLSEVTVKQVRTLPEWQRFPAFFLFGVGGEQEFQKMK